MLPRPDRPHDQLLSRQMKTSDSVVSAIGGVVVGYVLWLIAISIGDDVTTVSRWSLLVLLGSAVLAVCAGVWGWSMRRRGQICRGGVCVQPADTSRAADVGRADQPLRLATIAGCPAESRGRLIVAASPSYWLASKQNSISWRRSRWPASCCQVAAVIVRSLTNSSVAASSARCRALSAYPSGTSGQAKIAACMLCVQPGLARHPAVVLQLVFAGAQMRDPQNHQFGVDPRQPPPQQPGAIEQTTSSTAAGAGPAW